MSKALSLLRRIARTFGFQALFITGAVILGILAVRFVLEETMIQRALELEAQFFIEQRQTDPHFPLPRTRNLVGFLDGDAHPVPASVAALATGMHFDVPVFASDPNSHPVHISHMPDGRRLYLIFSTANVDRLVFFFGVIPLVAALLLIYLSAWVGYRISQRAVSPVITLARRVSRMEPADSLPPLSKEFSEGDAGALARAVDRFAGRIRDFIQREREFTGDASHELRTPVTVIRGAVRTLEKEPGLTDKGRERVAMIRRSANNMSELIDALLTLARESSRETEEGVLVNAVVEECVAECRELIADKPVTLHVEAPYELRIHASERSVAMVIGNLVRNACVYTDQGEVTIKVTGTGVVVLDTGPGVPERELPRLQERGWRGAELGPSGTGIGLALAERLCQRYGWRLLLKNRQEGRGFHSEVRFFPE